MPHRATSFDPNFFVNTPDINPVFLQRSGRAGFLIRAALAATLSGLWGVYSGFELCEATPVPGQGGLSRQREVPAARLGLAIGPATSSRRSRAQPQSATRTRRCARISTCASRTSFDPNILYFVEGRRKTGATSCWSRSTSTLQRRARGRFRTAALALGIGPTTRPSGHRPARRPPLRWQGKVQRMRLDPGVNPYAIWRVSL